MSNNLLVLSIYSDSGDADNELFFKLQKDHLARTTQSYDFFILYSGVTPPSYIREHVIWCSGASTVGISLRAMCETHLAALHQAATICAQQDYAKHLILDSDAFPFGAWQSALDNAMLKHQKTIAAPIRTENLDLFCHPSIVYFEKTALAKMQFGLQSHDDMCGAKREDTALSCPRHTVFPLMRTNRHNYHPIMGAVYYNCFYHHGAGSRAPLFRATKYYYPEAVVGDEPSARQELFKLLAQDSNALLAALSYSPKKADSLKD